MIHETAIIYPNVKIGRNVTIGAYCIIGAPAEDKKHWYSDSEHSVVIDDNAIITGHVTIDAGTVRDTYIGTNTFIMKAVHIGHDCIVDRNVTIACHSLLGGHTRVLNGANLGLGTIAHQNSIIGHFSMIGMGTIITKKSKIEPFGKYVGSPAKLIGKNEVAIERNNLTEEQIEDCIRRYNAYLPA